MNKIYYFSNVIPMFLLTIVEQRHEFLNWDHKTKSWTLLTLYCTKSWWGQVVTDNQGLTKKQRKITMLL